MTPSFSNHLAYPYSVLGSNTKPALDLPCYSRHDGPRSRRKTPAGFPQSLILVCCALGFILVGFFLGKSFAQHFHRLASRLSGTSTLATESTVFRDQSLYGQGGADSDVAWELTIPTGQGVFEHSEIVPNGGRHAVLGQLECLNVVRRSHWTLVDAAMSPNGLETESMPHKILPEQVGQCIDLIRQALKCNPDLAVQSGNRHAVEKARFGGTYHCKNWDQLAISVQKWVGSDA